LAEVSSRLNHSWSQCVFPTLELWNDALRRVFAPPQPLSCSKVEQNWVYVDNGSLRISDLAVQRHGPISCNYTPIHRGRDDFEVYISSHIWPFSVALSNVNVKNILLIGGTVCREFESEAPVAEEMLDRDVCSREQFSFQMCLESGDGSGTFRYWRQRVSDSWCRDTECCGL